MKQRIAEWFRRNAQMIPLTVIAFCVGSILLLQAVTIGQLNDNLREIKGIVERQGKNAKERSDQINNVDKHLDCIVQFFSEPYRTSKTIDDIKTCQITTNEGAAISEAPQTEGEPNSVQPEAPPKVTPEDNRPPKKGIIERITEPLIKKLTL